MKGQLQCGDSKTRVLSAICFAFVSLGVSSARADLELGSDLDSSETIEQLTVRLTILAEGDDVSEPVALDLGLGFPLWLHPLGSEVEDVAVFGAVPNRTSASNIAAAGSTVEFTFEPAGEPGQDKLHSTSQLLASVRVSDISRIGLMSSGASNWILGGYEVEINGSLFAVNHDVGVSVSEQRRQAQARIRELTPMIEPLQREAAELDSLIEAELAFEEDLTRREEISGQLLPLLREQTVQERLLAGSYPWFEESGFEPEWRREEPIAEASVTVVTSPHTGADTQNYVYFRTGGHRYLLSSPLNPLSADAGPQQFLLDLVSGPLVASDLRGYAVGMLGNPEPYDSAPDRWHPQRLIVEVNGRKVYDSEEQEVDRLSLEAIRLIPPAHLDAAVLSNATTRQLARRLSGKPGRRSV